VDLQDVDLEDALQRAWTPLAGAAAARGLRVNREGMTGGAARTDPGLLATVLRNALDNAVSYADPGGEIFLASSGDARAGRLRIANTGCTLSQAEAEALCDRFRRGDPARSATAEHFGLGLALLRSIVHVLGGTVTIRAQVQGLYELEIALPPAAGDGTVRQ
jgi:two-component system heavy metal sensor histidine kinase CusS